MPLPKILALALAVLLLACLGLVAFFSWRTEADIAALENRVAALARAAPLPQPSAAQMAALPEPVQRYFAFALPGPVPQARLVRLSAKGQFRRPLSQSFAATTAEQTIATGTPALMFSATTPVLPGIWARAYDFFAEGQMEMKAKILSTLTVVDERESPVLNVISLRRWLLESALYPQALLPGGPVSWTQSGPDSAIATVTAHGQQARMQAFFDAEGRMTRMRALEDGDLSTPYHGSGEDVTRADYRLVQGMMIPHRFVISRRAGGQNHPFFDAALTEIAFE